MHGLWKRGWSGLLLDGSHANASINLHTSFISSKTIVATLRQHNVPLELDYLSVDIDSADLWVLRAILTEYKPRIVTIEYNSNFGFRDGAITFPDPATMPILHGHDAFMPPSCYMGASARAIMMLADAHGYGLVAIEPGLDLFLARRDLLSDEGSEGADAARGAKGLLPRLDPQSVVSTKPSWRSMMPSQAENLLDYEAYLRTGSVCEARASARRILRGYARAYRQMPGRNSTKQGLECFRRLSALPAPNCSASEHADARVPADWVPTLGICQTEACTKHALRKKQSATKSTPGRMLSPSGSLFGPKQIAIPLGMKQPPHKPCLLTTWGQDGFGHQMMARLSCEAFSLMNSSYGYVRSLHDTLEHSPPDGDDLIGLLNFPQGEATIDTHEPVGVPAKHYHPNCKGWDSRRQAFQPPACNEGKIAICDNCFDFVRLGDVGAQGEAIRKRLAGWVRDRVAGASTAYGTTCQHKIHWDVCVHVRGVGSPGPRTSKLVTSMASERDNVFRRMRVRTTDWWFRAMSQAARVATSSASKPLKQLRVRMHSNREAMAPILNLTTLHGIPVEFSVGNSSTPLLQLLHELIFCCNTMIDGNSALSSVAALATRAKYVLSSTPRNKELGFRYDGTV